MTENLETTPQAGTLATVSDDKAEAYALLMRSVKGEVDLLELYDSEEVQRALALGLLGSETLEEVFGAQSSLEPWSALLGRPVDVLEVHFNASKTEKGPGFYAVVKLVEVATGEQSTRHIGGYRPSAQLLWAWGHDRLPLRCKVTEIGKAQAGQSAPLGLELVGNDD